MLDKLCAAVDEYDRARTTIATAVAARHVVEAARAALIRMATDEDHLYYLGQPVSVDQVGDLVAANLRGVESTKDGA